MRGLEAAPVGEIWKERPPRQKQGLCAGVCGEQGQVCWAERLGPF